MERYYVTELQMGRILSNLPDAALYQREWGIDSDYIYDLIAELKEQSIVTGHTIIDDALLQKLSFTNFKLGAYLDRLEDTLNVYENHDALELLENIKACQENINFYLGRKVR